MSSPNPTTPDPLVQAASCYVLLPWARASELVTTALHQHKEEPADSEDLSDHLPGGFETKWTLSYELHFETTPPMNQWAKENLIEGYEIEREGGGILFKFKNPDDALVFRLRWS